jgi:hypothetical protein
MPPKTRNDFHVAIVGKSPKNTTSVVHSHHPTNNPTGAGIGGLALAMALHKKDISFTLYEEAREFSAVG